MGLFDKAKAKAEELADKAQGAAAEHDLSGKAEASIAHGSSSTPIWARENH